MIQKALQEKIEFGEARQMISDVDEDFSQEKNVLRIDLACGESKKEGFEGVDEYEVEGVDRVFNILEFPWPLETNSVGEFFCSHFVEHIPHDLHNGSRFDGLVQFMDEVYRCLMPGGLITIISPYYTSIRAWQDPTHCRAISEATWQYFNNRLSDVVKLRHYLGVSNFEVIAQQFILDEEYIHRAESARTWAMRHNWNAVKDLQVTLRSLKEI